MDAFGTTNSLGQRAEHERITRAALACAPGTQSIGECFEPKSMDQLAGHTGTFGAIGAPDLDELLDHPEAHCDDADFLNIPGYPQTRAEATAHLQACIDHLRMRFQQGRDAADSLVTPDGTLSELDVDLSVNCTFTFGIPGRAKCNVLEGLGRALHGAQDFYAHSNWADQADPTAPISIENPPGLNLLGPSPLLDLRATGAVDVPADLSTGFFKSLAHDDCPGTDGRVTHACLNKDKELIDPVLGVATDPISRRARIGANAQQAVTAAIAETRRQWDDFRAELTATYGPERGGQMILALVQDVPTAEPTAGPQPLPPGTGLQPCQVPSDDELFGYWNDESDGPGESLVTAFASKVCVDDYLVVHMDRTFTDGTVQHDVSVDRGSATYNKAACTEPSDPAVVQMYCWAGVGTEGDVCDAGALADTFEVPPRVRAAMGC
ncbi:MAG TPA: hypothetical protein VGJ60_03850 [Chloroflexota bacterium]